MELITRHHTGTSNTNNKSTINMKKSKIYKIGANYTKNIHNNFKQDITVNLNTTLYWRYYCYI